MKRSASALPPLEEVDWALAVSKIMRVSKRCAAAALEGNDGDVEAACDAITHGMYDGPDASPGETTSVHAPTPAAPPGQRLRGDVATLSRTCAVSLQVNVQRTTLWQLSTLQQEAEDALRAMEFDVSAAEEYLLIHCYSVGYHCAPVTVEVLLCISTAIEVTKLLQEITPVASKPSTSPPKVIPKLC